MSNDALAGLRHNLFFWDHNHKEEAEDHTLSHVNQAEAKMAVALALHLLRWVDQLLRGMLGRRSSCPRS